MTIIYRQNEYDWVEMNISVVNYFMHYLQIGYINEKCSVINQSTPWLIVYYHGKALWLRSVYYSDDSMV